MNSHGNLVHYLSRLYPNYIYNNIFYDYIDYCI